MVINAAFGGLAIFMLLYNILDSANLRYAQALGITTFFVGSVLLLDLGMLFKIINISLRKEVLRISDWKFLQVGSILTLLGSVGFSSMIFWVAGIQIFTLLIVLGTVLVRLALLALSNQGRNTESP
jgi:hypothetical protein